MQNRLFWSLVNKAHKQAGDDMNLKCTLITKEISMLSGSKAGNFYAAFDEAMDKAYTWPLWGAAYIVAGGCSDDAFSDFRASLVSRGQAAFEKAVSDPDSLANESFDEDVWFYEGYQYAIGDGVEAVLEEMPERYAPHPKNPDGEEWSEYDDSLKNLLPNLWAASEGATIADKQTVKTQAVVKKSWWQFWK